ncbi:MULTISPECIES: hypothetical protein [Pseudonocardia]|uniref:Uncharacterized protein n=2 Tax=Pseudonocardia TaxID=1847 RepID=A0A1Y2N5K7_PSEAH|nr:MULTISPECIES: hypothetical protein [Pseudonocardia]OSY42726.1 hypothetical protein BG845_00967 [Pseudonocardia autotrophica]TDN77303.1 hypothetical protein C8E95_6549 [Pseudonocardia autotrophica]BBG01325.1 hypothetical protein Pdca_25340 [Pseudonocardia autotrophica]GEC24381.1 hypothetical protein PSA01_14100 [Pseudonocardia saturnea]
MTNQHPTVAPARTVDRAEVTEQELRDLGVDLARDFPGSTAADFLRYPVLSEGGWFMVVKHQPTLRSVSREPWDLFGPIHLTSHGLDLS